MSIIAIAQRSEHNPPLNKTPTEAVALDNPIIESVSRPHRLPRAGVLVADSNETNPTSPLPVAPPNPPDTAEQLSNR